jgi:hypothetical protein
MEIRAYPLHIAHRNVFRQDGVHCPPQITDLVPPLGVKGDDLPQGVNTCVRTTCCQNARP